MDIQSVCYCCKKFTKEPKICSKCRYAVYCSNECQAMHWKEHKVNCMSKTEDNSKILKLRQGFDSYLSENPSLIDLVTAIFYGSERFTVQQQSTTVKINVVVIPQIILINSPWEKEDKKKYNATYVLQKTCTKDVFIKNYKKEFPNLKTEDIPKYNIVEVTYYDTSSDNPEDMDKYKLQFSYLVILANDPDILNHTTNTKVLGSTNAVFESELSKEDRTNREERYKTLFKEDLSKFCVDSKDGLTQFVSCFYTNRTELPLRNILYLQYVQMMFPNKAVMWSTFK